MRTETHQIHTYDSMARFHNQEWISYPPQSSIKQADPSSHITLPDLHGNVFKLLDILMIEGVLLMLEEHYAELQRVIHLPIEQQSLEDIERCIAIIQHNLGFNPVQCVRLIGDECGDRGINDFWTLCLIDQLHKNLPSVEILLSNHGEFFLDYIRDNHDAITAQDYQFGSSCESRLRMIQRIRDIHPAPIWYDHEKMDKPKSIVNSLTTIRDSYGDSNTEKKSAIDNLIKDLQCGSGYISPYKDMMTLVEQRRSLLNMHNLIQTHPALLTHLNNFLTSYKQCLRLISYSSGNNDQLTMYSHAPIRVTLIDEMYNDLCYSSATMRQGVGLQQKIIHLNEYFQHRLFNCQDYGILQPYIHEITWEKNEAKVDRDNHASPSSIMTVHGHTSDPSIRDGRFNGIDSPFGKTEFFLPYNLWEYFTEHGSVVIEKTHNYEATETNRIYLIPLETPNDYRLLLNWRYYSESDDAYLLDKIDIRVSVNFVLSNWIGQDTASFSRQLSKSSQEHCDILSLFLPFLSHISLSNLAAENICLISSDQPMGFKCSGRKPTYVSNHGLFFPIQPATYGQTDAFISRPKVLVGVPA